MWQRVRMSLYVTHWHAHTHLPCLSWRSPSCYKTVKSSSHLFASPVNHKHNLCLQRPNAARSPAEDSHAVAQYEKCCETFFFFPPHGRPWKLFCFIKMIGWEGGFIWRNRNILMFYYSLQLHWRCVHSDAFCCVCMCTCPCTCQDCA